MKTCAKTSARRAAAALIVCALLAPSFAAGGIAPRLERALDAAEARLDARTARRRGGDSA